MPNVNATLLASVNGGAPASGAQTAALGDEVQFSFASTVGWSGARLELHAPPDFPTLAGWTASTIDGHTTLYVLGRTPPAPVTLSVWGKYMTRLVVNGGLAVDEATAISVPSPNGLLDLGHREAGQFGGSAEKWTKDQRENLRVIEDFVAGGGGGGGGSDEDVNPTADTLVLRGAAGEAKATRVETSVVRTTAGGDVTLQHGTTAFARVRSTSACSQPGDLRFHPTTGQPYTWLQGSGEVPMSLGALRREYNVQLPGGGDPIEPKLYVVSGPSDIALEVVSAYVSLTTPEEVVFSIGDGPVVQVVSRVGVSETVIAELDMDGATLARGELLAMTPTGADVAVGRVVAIKVTNDNELVEVPQLSIALVFQPAS